MKLSDEQVSILKKNLLDLKKEIEDKQSNRHFDESMKESVGEITTGIGNHLAEGNAERVEREQEFTLELIDERLLEEITEAFERMENGIYGICIDTGEMIPYERLEVLPYAKRTAEAQDLFDKELSVDRHTV